MLLRRKSVAGWGQWQSWSTCSKSCGLGKEYCQAPASSESHESKKCKTKSFPKFMSVFD